MVLATIYESFISINQSTTNKNGSSSSNVNPNFIKTKHHFELHQITPNDNNNLRNDTSTTNNLHSKLGKKFSDMKKIL